MSMPVSDKRNMCLVLIILATSLLFVITCTSVNAQPAGLETVSIARTITENQSFNNTPIDDNVTEAGGTEVTVNIGDRSQSRFICGAIVLILIMQMIILTVIIQCRKRKTYIIKRK